MKLKRNYMNQYDNFNWNLWRYLIISVLLYLFH
jgi:hypothetical protein